MICKNCNTENADSSIFCKTCGNRIDGKKICPICNFANKEEDTFCSKCGARIDGKKFCANCGNEVEGLFCTSCGQKYNAKQSRTANANDEKVKNLSPLARILDTVGNSILMLGVALSLIFIFFVGLANNLPEIGLSGNLASNNNIFYYFGKAYEDLKLLFPGIGKYSASIEISAYLPTIILTSVSALSLAGCIIFAILATVRFVKKLCFGGKASPVLFSLLAIAFYVICAVSFKNTNYLSISGLGMEEVTEYFSEIQLNSTTSTGLTLVIICALLYYTITIVDKCLSLNASKIVAFVLSLVTNVLLIVAIILAVKTYVSMNISIPEELLKGSITTSFTMFATILTTINTTKEMLSAVILSGFTQITSIVGVFLLLLAVSKTMSNEKSSSIIMSFACALLLINMILSFVTINLYTNTLSELASFESITLGKYITIGCPLAIVSFIISLLPLIVNIVKNAVAYKSTDFKN